MEIEDVDFKDSQCYVMTYTYSYGGASHNFVFPDFLILLNSHEIESYFVEKFTKEKAEEDVKTKEMLEKEKQRKVDHAVKTLTDYGYLVVKKD